MGGNPRPAFLPIRSEHFPDADGVLAFLCRQPGGLLAVVKFAQLLFRRSLCFPVSGKCQHPAFASHFEGETVKRESFGRAVNCRCKVTKFDFDREDHTLVVVAGCFLCKFCANCHRTIDFIGFYGSRGRTRNDSTTETCRSFNLKLKNLQSAEALQCLSHCCWTQYYYIATRQLLFPLTRPLPRYYTFSQIGRAHV